MEGENEPKSSKKWCQKKVFNAFLTLVSSLWGALIAVGRGRVNFSGFEFERRRVQDGHGGNSYMMLALWEVAVLSNEEK